MPVNSGRWGPLSHTYGAGAVGTNHILASLISSGNVNKTVSAPLSIFVLQHSTAITLDPVSDVGVGGTLTVTGRMTDTDANVGISGQPVSFKGTGIGTLSNVNTNATGYFTASGTASNTPATGLTIQARFVGDLALFPTSSTIRTYNILAITGPPEAFNQFDPVSKDVVVYGVDSTGKIFGPIAPTSVAQTTWDPDDDKGGDHSQAGSKGGDDDHKPQDHSKTGDKGGDNDQKSGDRDSGDNPKVRFQSYGGQSQIIFQAFDDHKPAGHSRPSDKGGDNDKKSGDQRDDSRPKPANTGHGDDDQYYPGNDHSNDGLKAELRTFNIVDTAGNSLVLVEKVVKSDNQINVHVISMQYDNGPVMPAPVNLKHFSWSYDKHDKPREIDQAMIVGRFALPTIFVHAEFSQETNQTHIQVIQYGQHPQVMVKAGLDLIKMLTGKGSLTVQY